MLRFTPARSLLGYPPYLTWESRNVAKQYLACRVDFFSPSPISNPKLQQGCQGVHSL